MATMSGSAVDLSPVEIHDVLSNERRKMVIDLLRRERTEISARDLSEYIAERETGESPPPRNKRQSAYVSLHQTHLPKLDELGIIEYDQSEKTVALDDEASREVSVYMETVPRYGISWSEYYAGVSTLGLLLVAATEVGVPVIEGVGAAVWASVVLAVVTVSAAYQTTRQGSSFLHRLGVLGETAEESGTDPG
jgi:hypothetical protein